MKLSLIYGIPFSNWIRLLKENHFAVSPCYLHRAFLITAMSIFNTYHHWREERVFGPQINKTQINKPPIFILGHWRNGTSHLQCLISQDPELSTPNMFQTLFPYTFLSFEDIATRKLGSLVPPRRPEDRMKLSFNVPSEDEIAVAMMSLKSLYLMWSFPKKTLHYQRYINFQSVSQKDLDIWKSSYMRFLKKLTLKHNAQLVLKSPANTARIKILLDIFPKARFIHIHRNPYRVFQSMRHLILTWTRHHALLQHRDLSDVNDIIIRIYRTIYNAFFEQVKLIPKGQFHEVGFEDLEENPIHEMDNLYKELGLKGFQNKRWRFERYLESVQNYQKNTFRDLDLHLKKRIAREWQNSFRAWGYKT